MKLYMIGLTRANSKINSKIENITTGKYFRYTDTIYFVASDSTAEEIAHAIGLKGNNKVEEASGLVAKMNGSYSGFTKRSLWDWIDSIDIEL